MNSDSSSLTSADGSPVYLEVCTSFLCSWGRRVQQKPAHACMSPAKTRDKLCSTWDCGGSPGTACQHSRWAVSQDQAFVCHHSFLQNGNERFVGLPFFFAYIALTISKYPHRRGALRYALSMEKKKSSKLWKVSYRVLWIGNYEWQIVPGGLKFLRCACAKRPVKKSEFLYMKLFLADLLYQQGMLYWSSRSRRS